MKQNSTFMKARSGDAYEVEDDGLVSYQRQLMIRQNVIMVVVAVVIAAVWVFLPEV